MISAVSDITIIGFDEPPEGKAYNHRQAFSYHVYCALPDRKGDPRSLLLCDTLDDILFTWRTREAKKLGGGTFLGEFGALSNSTTGIKHLNWMLDAVSPLHLLIIRKIGR